MHHSAFSIALTVSCLVFSLALLSLLGCTEQGANTPATSDQTADAPDMSAIKPCELVTLEEAIALLATDKKLVLGSRRAQTSRTVHCNINSESGIPQLMTHVHFARGMTIEQMIGEEHETIAVSGKSLPVHGVYTKADPKFDIQRTFFQMSVQKGDYVITLTPSYLKVGDKKDVNFQKLVEQVLKAADRLKI